jgi:outer membrane receptor protein involved in Fe transport
MAKWVLALMAGTALLPMTAYAQATAGNDTDKASRSQSDEIVVTAQRYEQRLQDVPLSISVIGSKELGARAATDIKDLQYSVPGLSMFEYGVSRQYIQLRGISNTIGSSTIGIYLDETPLGLDIQGDAFSVRLLDLERVEVLRGPQATLYGQGSMGGTIRYIPAAPRLDAIGGSVAGEYSSTEAGASNYKTVAVLNLPLSKDVVGLRLVGGYERVGGFIDNVVSGQKDINSADIYTVRGTLLAKASDRLTLSLMGLYQKSEQANQDFGVNRKTNSLVSQPINDRYTLIQGKASYDLDFAELSGSASYIDRHNKTTNDVSSALVPYLPLFGIPVGFVDRIALTQATDYKIFNGEVRLASQSEGPLGWAFGATYRDLKTRLAGESTTAPGTVPFTVLAINNDARSRSYALYGEVNYAFTSHLKASAGLRYFSDHKEQNSVNTNFGFTTTDPGNGNFHSINPRFNLSYEFTPNSMVFVNAAKGFRSGGFNNTSAGGGVVIIPPTYNPDEIWTYELGTKHQLFGNKLVLDASLYRSEWSYVQSYGFAPGSVIGIVNNSGHVSGWGVDLSATARPTRTLALTATYGWNNLAYDSASQNKDKQPGDPVDAAVRESYSASLDFRPPMNDSVTGIFRIDYQHAGKAQITLRNFAPALIVSRPSRDIVNLRIGAAVGAVEVTLFANNLFDENAPNIIGPFGVISENVEQRPRVIGISAGTKF